MFKGQKLRIQVFLPDGPLTFFSKTEQLYLTKPTLIRIIIFIDGKFAWYFLDQEEAWFTSFHS
jgi:hypothetical protein